MTATQPERRCGIAYTVIDWLHIEVYGATNPTDQEWQAYLAFIQRQGIDGTKHLVFTEGGGPTLRQHRALEDLLGGRALPVAIVSASLRVRWTVTVLSWFNLTIRAFRPANLHDAMVYLEVPSTRAAWIANTVLPELWLQIGRHR